MKTFIGIDNGVSGAIGIVFEPSGEALWYPMPTKRVRDYTKKKQFLRRVDTNKLTSIVEKIINIDANLGGREIVVIIERPLDTPKRYKASKSAMRCFEATLIVLESFSLIPIIIDSREWQKVMLPSIGSGDSKSLSSEIGEKLFPKIKFKADADALLIAEWARRTCRD